mmetsp:Transcript_8230/g.24546  ORF Transcript_8230/g.24546 Transcript_8230/m.24546 type:complete len:216 (-) Transcript_8230:305-952(-)|eukprot:CAMPEP_0206141610 /NCGR_PEP_ID=MMETSP1473-20131121/13562_1 /ASSEMBLY_ACC=CAM_ASM_001109 /TAXON_ID=1461547 /ORGANISM="Stichococcus sp, Strain RCC1054" /LENGTH=215 /DNA_ID=CAMNT_0053536245 /DNA_START=309 /DNA_END=956 /DNA_ORIENTATION=+
MALFQESDLQHTPDELEFFAEDELITIIPHFSLPTRDSIIHGIQGEWGPFEPSVAIDVPIWMAIYLFKRKQCDIKPPEWMQVDALREAYESERHEPNDFMPLPNHYLEIAHVLLIDAKGCFSSAKEYMETRDLVDQLRRLRSNKINDGLAVLAGPMTAKLNNVCAMEINTIRPFFLGAQNRYLKLSKMDEGAGPAARQSTQEDDTQPTERRNLGR